MSRQTQLSQFMNSGNGLSSVTDGRGVVHKERGEEKGKPPYNPLKEKEREKEISSFPSPSPISSPSRAKPHGEGEGKVDVDRSCNGEGKVLRLRRGEVDDFIRYSERDSVEIALALLKIPRLAAANGRSYNNPRIMRSIRKTIGDDVFREAIVQQWHENDTDGAPRSAAAAFMAKLNALKADMVEGGAA